MNGNMNKLVDLFEDLALDAKKIKGLSFVHWDSMHNGCADPSSEDHQAAAELLFDLLHNFTGLLDAAVEELEQKTR